MEESGQLAILGYADCSLTQQNRQDRLAYSDYLRKPISIKQIVFYHLKQSPNFRKHP